MRKLWGRDCDVEEIFSIKRNALRELHRRSLVQGALVKLSGEKSGIRLWDLNSIEKYLRTLSINKTCDKSKKIAI